MKKVVLNNGITLIYEYTPGSLTSFSIGFDAGAFREDGFTVGTAHSLEHILFKGTKYRDEKEINNTLDRIFAFNNAMTNFPYVIYYGTCLKEDFREGFLLYSEIVSKPSFTLEGFEEEIEVIVQECKEWGEDLEQRIEDELLGNAFKERRIKEIIIGHEDGIRSIEIEELKRFHNRYYVRNNCTVAVVSSLPMECIVELINKKLNYLPLGEKMEPIRLEEKLKNGYNEKSIEGINGAKILLLSDISKLTRREVQGLYIFNEAFGEGVSSPLYTEIRTHKGLAYEVLSRVKYEKAIDLYSIYIGTSKENKEKVISILKELINNRESFINDEEHLNILKRRVLMKKYRMEESSIQRAVNLCRENIMFNEELIDIEELQNITLEEIRSVASKILREYYIQVLN